jgi:hypothetical protein
METKQVNEHPEIAEINWIDDVFRVEETKYGAWKSYHIDGRCLIYALHKDGCVNATRFYLKGLQDGWDDSNTTKHEGTVGGKL